jgi:carboxyl-terminal processing protease
MISKKKAVLIVIATIILTIVVIIGIVIGTGAFRLFLKSDTDVFEDFSQVSKIIDIYFYKDIDSDALTTAAINGMVETLEDPYAKYYDKQAWIEFQNEQKGEYTGIGVQVNFDEEKAGVLITRVFPDSPAQLSGVLVGDLIIGYDDKSFEGFTYEDIVNVIRGKAGTNVKVEILRDDKHIFLDIVRQVVISDQAEYEIRDNNIGVLKLYSFSGNSLDLFKQAKEHFEDNNCESMIIDLRNNPGGDLNIVTSMLDILLEEGKLIITRDRAGNEDSISSDSKYWDIPLIVLTNEYSASASELFSIAIQDYERGEIVGETTYGKGVVQSIMPLGIGETGIKLTTSEYFSPLGRSINGKGVYPDHYIVDEDLFDEVDPQMDLALELLTE